jgi:predicted ester cyclase
MPEAWAAHKQQKGDGDMAADDNAAISRSIYDAFNRNDFARALEYATEDVEIVFIPTGQTFRGLRGFEDFMRGHKAAFPDVKIEVINQIAADNSVVNEFVAHGTHTGPLQTPTGTIVPTGRRVTFTVCEVCLFRDGKLAGVHNYQDMVALLQQLGLIGEPEQAGV